MTTAPYDGQAGITSRTGTAPGLGQLPDYPCSPSFDTPSRPAVAAGTMGRGPSSRLRDPPSGFQRWRRISLHAAAAGPGSSRYTWLAFASGELHDQAVVPWSRRHLSSRFQSVKTQRSCIVAAACLSKAPSTITLFDGSQAVNSGHDSHGEETSDFSVGRSVGYCDLESGNMSTQRPGHVPGAARCRRCVVQPHPWRTRRGPCLSSNVALRGC